MRGKCRWFPKSAKCGGDKKICSGFPNEIIRKDFRGGWREASLQRFPLPDLLPVVLIMGSMDVVQSKEV